MTIPEAEDALFTEWRKSRPDLVADGVADENLYLGSQTRLLFVLKEVNSDGKGGWDLREYMRNGGRSQTWNNITRWTEGIRAACAGEPEISWDALASIDAGRRKAALCSIAAINLKKSPGGHTTNVLALRDAAAQDNMLIAAQFALYEADFVICCGNHVTDALDCHVKCMGDAAWESTSRGIDYREYRPGKFVVAYAHPEARVADNLLYFGLTDAIREIRSRQTCLAAG